MNVGDWVQANDNITEEDFNGKPLHVHALRGAVGHIVGVVDPTWFTIYWERSGTVTDCDVSEFTRLCAGDAFSRQSL